MDFFPIAPRGARSAKRAKLPNTQKYKHNKNGNPTFIHDYRVKVKSLFYISTQNLKKKTLFFLPTSPYPLISSAILYLFQTFPPDLANKFTQSRLTAAVDSHQGTYVWSIYTYFLHVGEVENKLEFTLLAHHFQANKIVLSCTGAFCIQYCDYCFNHKQISVSSRVSEITLIVVVGHICTLARNELKTRILWTKQACTFCCERHSALDITRK